MTTTYSPGPPTDADLVVRPRRADDLPATGPDGLRAASAKTPGGIAADERGGGLALGIGDGTPASCFTAGRKLARALADVGDIGSVTLDLASLATETDDDRDDDVSAESGRTSVATAAAEGASSTPPADVATLAVALLRGLDVGRYELGLWRGERPAPRLADLAVAVAGLGDEAAGRRVLAQAAALGAGQRAAMHLVDRPANAKKPADVAAYVVELGRAHGFGVEVVDEEALGIQGFGGVLAVGRASDHPPRLLKLHYRGEAPRYRLGLVGKGVTFDTGGISIKPSRNLGYMKSDLGGAAAVLGAFVSVAELGLPVEVHGLLPVAENAIDGDAYLPSDVIRNYSGKTIEVTDTDAEGRLLLADCLAYFPEWATPDLLVDLATLTGSAVRTFGYEAAALFTHRADVVADFAAAGRPHDERTWPLPLWAGYEADLASDVADVKHFHGKPIAGAINAAKFLEYFVADRERWAHLDIAGVAFGASEFSHDRAATGYGVALLTQFLLDRVDDA